MTTGDEKLLTTDDGSQLQWGIANVDGWITYTKNLPWACLVADHRRMIRNASWIVAAGLVYGP